MMTTIVFAPLMRLKNDFSRKYKFKLIKEAEPKTERERMRVALYQPEIPQNTGTLMRLGACLGVALDIIEPCSFVWNDQKLRRAGMDYMDLVQVKRHASWDKFYQIQTSIGSRIVLLDAQATTSFLDFEFYPTDVLLLGQESSGVPESILTQVQRSVTIPMLLGRRSLNMAVSAAMVLTEALRQTNQFPSIEAGSI